MRVMQNRIEKKEIVPTYEVAGQSLEPDIASDNYNGSLANQKNNFVVMESHRVPVIVDEKMPPLSDDLNTNLKDLNTSQISMNINSTFRQQEQEEEEGE